MFWLRPNVFRTLGAKSCPFRAGRNLIRGAREAASRRTSKGRLRMSSMEMGAAIRLSRLAVTVFQPTRFPADDGPRRHKSASRLPVLQDETERIRRQSTIPTGWAPKSKIRNFVPPDLGEVRRRALIRGACDAGVSKGPAALIAPIPELSLFNALRQHFQPTFRPRGAHLAPGPPFSRPTFRIVTGLTHASSLQPSSRRPGPPAPGSLALSEGSFIETKNET